MTTWGAFAVGVGQCVNWGVLYYAFAMLVPHLERELGVATWVVTGAFSLALLASAGLAPTVGTWADRGYAARIMEVGGFGAAILLAAWTLVPGVAGLYAVWTLAGLCMAMTLYEPAFVLVARAARDPQTGLRAIALITLVGGLASTVFLPATAMLSASLGWRGAVLALAGVLALSTAVTRVVVFQRLAPVPQRPASQPPEAAALLVTTGRGELSYLTALFSLTSLASAAFVVNLVPALSERGLTVSAAAMVGGLMGVMQLPGRAMLMHGGLATSPARLLATSIGLHAVGLGAVAIGPSAPVVVGGAMVFALGAGLMTLVRPYVVQAVFGTARGGLVNGRIARHQQLARAAGPLAVAWLAGVGSYTAVFATVAAMSAVLAVISYGVLVGTHPLERRDYDEANTGCA